MTRKAKIAFPSGALLAHTQDLVANRPRSLTLKHVSTDVGISESWLKHFMHNRINDPSANKVEALYNYFSKTFTSLCKSI